MPDLALLVMTVASAIVGVVIVIASLVVLVVAAGTRR